MPKKKRKASSSDHLSTALESLRKRPQPDVGLDSDDKIVALGYVAGVGAEEKKRAGGRRRKSAGKQRMAFNLPVELCERARNAVWHLSDTIRINLSSLTQGTLERELSRLEKKYNGGRPFARRKGRLRGGPLRRPARRGRPRGRKTADD